MNVLALPALDGRTPLGFLAAVGVLRLLDEHTGDDPSLSWSPGDATAVLQSAAYACVEAVADALAGVVFGLGDGQVVPGAPCDLPPPGEAPDRLRLPRAELKALVSRLRVDGDPDVVDAWVGSLVTDLALDKEGRGATSLFAAPSGKQSMRTMLEKPLALVRRDPGLLHEALTEWRRVGGYTGEYLDHRVLFDAADAPDGKSSERGVPGATWLALMAYPLLRTTSSDGSAATSSGWSRRGRLQLRWPLWRQPLDVHAIEVLLDHPALLGARGDGREGGPGALAALGVFHVGTAERRRIEGRNFAGVLGPVDSGRP